MLEQERLGGRVERIVNRVITFEKAQKRAVARSARKSEGRRWKKGRKGGEVGAECLHLTIGRRLTIVN
jgi:hypothetical protein